MTIRLHPDDLGMVQVRIERNPSGPTQIEITAEKSDTLQALQRDQVRLHQTLDDAGIPTVGRTVTFHVAQAAHAAPGTAGTFAGTGQGSGQHASGSRTNNGAADPGGSAGGGRGGYPARETRSWSGNSSASGSAVGATRAIELKSYRVGLDITA
jgi:hypothetical protein